MDAAEAAPPSTRSQRAGGNAKTLATNMIKAIRMARKGKTEVAAKITGAGEGEEAIPSSVLDVESMSQTQLTKLVKATRTNRFSKAKKARRSIQTKEGKRRLSKR